ncbi:MAG TPA: hypothetical protein VMT94_09025 [Burkholderiales bacterium]|nr:hypothetical protein [Burkholderiales bacterium]
MKYALIRLLCNALTLLAMLPLTGALPAWADPPSPDGGGASPQAGFHHPRHALRETLGADRSPVAGPAGPEPRAGELSDDERRALRRDLERADREIYRK